MEVFFLSSILIVIPSIRPNLCLILVSLFVHVTFAVLASPAEEDSSHPFPIILVGIDSHCNTDVAVECQGS
jgi:hypothetical protein